MKKEYNLKKMKLHKRGPLLDEKNTKVQKTLRLDLDLIDWLIKEGDKRGIGYQTLINSVLREYMLAGGSVMTEEKIRAVVRDEIKKGRAS